MQPIPPPLAGQAAGGNVPLAALVSVLEAALDQNPQRRQPAEDLLQQWEPMPQYPSVWSRFVAKFCPSDGGFLFTLACCSAMIRNRILHQHLWGL